MVTTLFGKYSDIQFESGVLPYVACEYTAVMSSAPVAEYLPNVSLVQDVYLQSKHGDHGSFKNDDFTLWNS